MYRPYAAKPKQKDGDDVVSGSGHAFIGSGHQHQPVGSPCARENRSTRPTHPQRMAMVTIMIEQTK